ncbi:universal stress protein [Brevibacillus sp. SYP-B805]|uniref:universal stress protein n=1 Tax=Brevibacillus sp. SYP-B805 TaxID=1578199 RepID=UPI0013EB46A7|nr:universal stress protein [Brevibacillus sp. SYP-B805]NGQ93924.1 universal stress protein [Brevibacillus sp. SYP-B805]
MTRFLLPIDGSEPSKRALEYALALTTQADHLTLLHVLQPFPAQHTVHYLSAERIKEIQNQDAMKTMAPILQQVEKKGIPYSMHIAYGVPDELICRYAENNHDFVIMGTHGYGAVSSFLHHSVSYPTLQRLTIPVVLIPELITEAKMNPRPFRKILIAVDGSEYAWKAAEAAINLGRRTGAHFSLLHVVVPPIVNTGLENLEWTSDAELLESGKSVVEKYEQRFISHQLPYTTHVAVGDPGHLIQAFAEETGSDLIAMGHRGLNRLAGILLGSVVYKVIHGTKIPLLIA